AAGMLLTTPPEGSGPWSLTVLATGAPREGHQTATLGTPPDIARGFLVAATLPRYPIVVPGDLLVLDGPIRPRPDSPYGEYLERIGAVGTLTARAIEVAGAPPRRWRACSPSQSRVSQQGSSLVSATESIATWLPPSRRRV